jgi:hypothetical protein
LTLKFPEDLVIHPDPYDRPIVAEIDLSMEATNVESELEIQYRIQAYEGNVYLERGKEKVIGEADGQIYPISFIRE